MTRGCPECEKLHAKLKEARVNLDNGRTVTCMKCGETAFGVCTHLAFAEKTETTAEVERLRTELATERARRIGTTEAIPAIAVEAERRCRLANEGELLKADARMTELRKALAKIATHAKSEVFDPQLVAGAALVADDRAREESAATDGRTNDKKGRDR